MPGSDRPTEASDLLSQLRIDRGGDRPRRRRGRLLAVGVLLLFLVGAAAVWSGVVPLPFLVRPPVVKTAVARAVVQPGTASVLDASGYVTARRQATVSAKITGKVAEVMIEEGQRVKEGDVLARLDDTDVKAQLLLARAQLTAARSQLAEVQALLRQAERDHARQAELFVKQLVSAQSLDAAIAQRDMLRARLAAAEEQAKVAQEAVNVAQVAFDNTVIRAPFSGIVVAKSAQPGEMISPISAGGGFTRTGIGTIVDMDSLEIQVDVNESYINRVTPGQPVEAVLNAYPEWKIPGEVIAIIPTADRSKATVKVRIALKQKDPRIVPDMGARVGFLDKTPAATPKGSAGVLVPSPAIQTDGGRSVAFVVKGGKVERRSVTLGPETAGHRQVLSGIRDGERVVLAAPPSLKDGQSVTMADGT